MDFNKLNIGIPSYVNDIVEANVAQKQYDDFVKQDELDTNRMMRRWTVAIGIMTAVMLLATITNVVIFVLRG